MTARGVWTAAIVSIAMLGGAAAQDASEDAEARASTPRAVGSADAFTREGGRVSEDIFGIDEIRAGAFGQVTGVDPVDDGGGAYGQFEALFAKPSWLFENPLFDLFFRPRPHLGGSIALDDGTSKAFAGLTWDVWLNESFFLEGSLGLALHDGALDDPAPGEPALGCRVLMREGASAGVALSPNWRVVASFGHSSNAGLCDENDGLTEAGLSIGYSF